WILHPLFALDRRNGRFHYRLQRPETLLSIRENVGVGFGSIDSGCRQAEGKKYDHATHRTSQFKKLSSKDLTLTYHQGPSASMNYLNSSVRGCPPEVSKRRLPDDASPVDPNKTNCVV